MRVTWELCGTRAFGLVARATELDHRSPRPSAIAGTARSRTRGAPVGGVTGAPFSWVRALPTQTSRRPPLQVRDRKTTSHGPPQRDWPRQWSKHSASHSPAALSGRAAHRGKASRHPARCLPRTDQGRPGRRRPECRACATFPARATPTSGGRTPSLPQPTCRESRRCFPTVAAVADVRLDSRSGIRVLGR